MKVAVITISDRAYRGVYEDLSGPEIASILTASLAECVTIERMIVPDEAASIEEALEAFSAGETPADVILTTGGTGIGPRDITPDVCRSWCDRELPGIAETLRSESYRETPTAMLSRGYAGMKGATVVINFPGSLKAVRLCTRIIIPVITHAEAMIRGEGH